MTNRYSLSDADMLGINERIDKANSASDVIYAAVMGTWDAILAQEGMTFYEYTKAHGTINPMEFAIPADQATEIMERMKKRLLALDISPIGVTNAMLDWVNVGPSSYNDAPKQNATDHILPPPVFTIEDAVYAKRLAEQDGYYDN